MTVTWVSNNNNRDHDCSVATDGNWNLQAIYASQKHLCRNASMKIRWTDIYLQTFIDICISCTCPGNSILSMFECVYVFEAAIFIEKINNSRSKVAMSKENRVLLFAVLFLFWFVFFFQRSHIFMLWEDTWKNYKNVKDIQVEIIEPICIFYLWKT